MLEIESTNQLLNETFQNESYILICSCLQKYASFINKHGVCEAFSLEIALGQSYLVEQAGAKCYHGGQKIDLITCVSAVITEIVPICSVFQMPHHESNPTLLAIYRQHVISSAVM